MLGLSVRPGPLPLRVSAEEEQAADRVLDEVRMGRSALSTRLVMLQPGARYWFKAWPAERFAELAGRLAEQYGCRILIGGDARERDLAEAIRANARTPSRLPAG